MNDRFKTLYGAVDGSAAAFADNTALYYMGVRISYAQLKKDIDEKVQIDEMRKEFIANVSHELKTPLASMKVLADSLLLQEDAPVELYKEFMGDMSEEIERENKIINDLLSLVKMDKTANLSLIHI